MNFGYRIVDFGLGKLYCER